MRRILVVTWGAILLFTYPILDDARSAYSQSDTTPPSLTELSITPSTVNVDSGPQDVVVTARVTDDYSGTYTVAFRIDSPGTNDSYVSCGASRISGDNLDGIYECTLTIPQYAEVGTWLMFGVFTDNLINRGWLYQGDLEALGFPNSVVVNSIPLLSQTTKLLPQDGGQPFQFGVAVSLSGNRALVGSVVRGAAYIFDYDGTNWIETAKVVPSDATSHFGWFVDLDGDRAVIGATRDPVNGANSGAAYVFDFNGNNWIETAKLVPSDGNAEAEFGSAVAVSGNRILIGSRHDDDNGYRSGSAYIFDYRGKKWNETTKLLPSDGTANAIFGFSVDLEGSKAVVGARRDGAIGSVYVFEKAKKSWDEQQKIVSSDRAYDDEFGYAVSLEGDRLLIGARLDNEAGTNDGSAYVFDFDGSSWVESQKLVMPDNEPGDEAGVSVSLEGDNALIGAWRSDDFGDMSGSAYLYEFDGSSWVNSYKLLPSDGTTQARFGVSVSMDAGNMLVGAYYDSENGTQSGSAYIFREPIQSDDTDGDAVANSVDLCPATSIPEVTIPSSGSLKTNRWVLLDGDIYFDTVSKGKGSKQSYSTIDTGGCSCEQILPLVGTTEDEVQFGCTKTTLELWVASVSGGAGKGGNSAQQTASSQQDENNMTVPSSITLSDNYPNPFNPTTTFEFNLPENADVSLRIFDVLGREVAVLHEGPTTKGRHTVRFEAGLLPSGLYIYQLLVADEIYTKSMILLK